MKKLNVINLLVKVLLILFTCASMIQAQMGYGFGQNKVNYKNFKWAIFKTKHFDVHYYPEMKETAHDAARMAERGYDYLSDVLDHKIEKRIPLILYASLNDFQQTNTIRGMLGDGTRGVTESQKGRVILPMTGSYREFNHVLVHELVHAFQFDMMSVYKGNERFNPPLWFVEGMAEYLSNGMDNTTRMWVADGLKNENLLTINELNSVGDIRVYRLGQSFWFYLGETFGKEKVGEVFKTAIRTSNIDSAFSNAVHLSDTLLSKSWHSAMKEMLNSGSTEFTEIDSMAQQITLKENFFHRLNLIPTISPNARHIAYVTNTSLKEEIYLLTEKYDKSGYDRKLLLTGNTSNSFEQIRIFASSMNWSNDSRFLAFVAKAGKNDVLYVFDVETKEIIYEIDFEELNGIQSPSFSPDAQRISFTGMYGGRSDLFVVDLKDKKPVQLTKDRYSVLHPNWSPDGNNIVFVTDRGKDSEEQKLLFGDYDLAIFNLENNEIKLLTELDGDVINPQWSADSKTIAFISDHRGVANIFKLDLSTNVIIPITTFEEGVSGITGSTPAFSWASAHNSFVFSTFKDESWQLYKMEFSEPAATQILMTNARDSENSDQWLQPVSEPNIIYKEYHLEESDSISQDEYSSALKLDGLILGGGFGGLFGSSAGGQMLFSDMMGNHNLLVSSQLRFSDFKNSDFGATYFNQSQRLNYGLQVFQQGSSFGSFFSSDGVSFIRQVYRGFNVFGLYPLSRFNRLEVSTGLTAVDQQFVTDRFKRSGFDRDVESLGTLHFAQFGLAWVFDNTIYGPLGPTAGTRARFSVQQAVKDLEFTTYFADYRMYFPLSSRTNLAWRIMGGSSVGPQSQFFRIGGPFSYRGADYNELLGTNFFVNNLEFRFPLLPFLLARSDFLSGFVFADAASAWGRDIPGFAKKEFQPFNFDGGFRLNDLNAALGVGARFNLGFLTLQYYVAWPTDLNSFKNQNAQFSIGTFF